MDNSIKDLLIERASQYNDLSYFSEDPIIFPREFHKRFQESMVCLADVEISAIFASHLAWGRRASIVKDCTKLFDFMEWKPFDYINSEDYRDDDTSLHRTIKWSEIARICRNLKEAYSKTDSLEGWTNSKIRTEIFGAKDDKSAPNKKINMMKRWMVRNDGIVDLGLWTKLNPSELLIPLDVHVYNVARELELTTRSAKNYKTVVDITDKLKEIFPDDPCLGDFALFGYGVSKNLKDA